MTHRPIHVSPKRCLVRIERLMITVFHVRREIKCFLHIADIYSIHYDRSYSPIQPYSSTLFVVFVLCIQIQIFNLEHPHWCTSYREAMSLQVLDQWQYTVITCLLDVMELLKLKFTTRQHSLYSVSYQSLVLV